MIIKEILGNESTLSLEGYAVDTLLLEWYEANKRILRKKTEGGTDVALKLLREGTRLRDGDVLLKEEGRAVVVRICPAEAIVLTPMDMTEMGTVCYEIGNKHMPLFIQDNEVMMPYEAPMFRWLESAGYRPRVEMRRLSNLLKENVTPHSHFHSHGEGGGSLFSKIINLTTSVSKD